MPISFVTCSTRLFSWLIEEDADPRTVAGMVGHSDPLFMLKLYAHSRAQQRKAPLLRAASRFD